MSSLGGPNIITNGLILSLDAANNKSYQSGSTTWYDKSGYNNNGTLINGPTFSSANNGSIVFDGTNDYVDCGNSSSLNITNQITLSAWINGTYGPTGEYAVIDKGGITGHHFGVYQRKIIFQPTQSYQQGNTILSDNTWYNIAISYDKTNVYFYLNGVSDGIKPQTGGLNSPSNPVWIGKYTVSAPLIFPGKISNAMIYSRMLSATEIQQNYNATKGRFNL